MVCEDRWGLAPRLGSQGTVLPEGAEGRLRY